MERIKEILPGIIGKLNQPEKDDQRLLRTWESIAGGRLAGHTKPSLGRNKIVYVWVDQSALAYELNQKHKKGFLKRIQNALGEEKVENIVFRVGQIR